MRIVFCGTPKFAVPSLRTLHESGFDIPLVVSQPDRPSGRGLSMAATPVKELATQLGIPITQPEKIKNNLEFRSQLEGLKPDAIVVVAYGRIVPQWMIDLPRFGNINAHASLLPKYRGAAPIQWAIAMGEKTTGITTMKIDAGLDTGDMLLTAEISIAADDTAETLSPKLAELAGRLLVRTLNGLGNGSVDPIPQDNAGASLAPLLTKEDGRIQFERPAVEINNRLRGFKPWPGAFTTFRGKNLSVIQAKPAEISVPKGELSVNGDRLFVGCASSTALELIEVQPEGKKRMAIRDFVNGYRPSNGECLS